MPHLLLQQTAHRPWPLISGGWVMQMRWCDLAFLHWRLPVAVLAAHIPAPLVLDTFEGEAWLGVVPFRMEGVRHRFAPAFPTVHAFAELNVRTYVRAPDGRAGVWFFSLDAASWLAVRAARLLYNLPYFDAALSVKPAGKSEDAAIRYRSLRTHRGAPAAEFAATYQPTGPIYQAAPGTLDHWLTERYCLFAQRPNGRIHSQDVHHQPWPLQPGTVAIEGNTMAEAAGLRLPDTPPLVHFARRLEVLAWGGVPVGGA